MDPQIIQVESTEPAPRPVEQLKSADTKQSYLEYCTKCQRTIETRTRRVWGQLNIILLIACIILPFLIVCFWMPCFMDVEHRCPNCNKPLSKATHV